MECGLKKKYIMVGAIMSVLIVLLSVYLIFTTVGNRPAPITITDDMGRKVTLARPASRVVSLAPSNTEILFAIGAGSKVVGVTKFCDYPAEVVKLVKEGKIEVVGGFVDISVEKVVALSPDVVFAYYGQKDVVLKLESMNISTVVFNPKNLDDIYRNIYIAGLLTGKVEEAQKLIKAMKNEASKVEKEVKNLEKKRVFFVVWGDPLMTAGNGTFINYLISIAGGINIFSDAEGWVTVNMESVIAKNPEVIILSRHSGIKVSDVLSNWSKSIDAVKNSRVYMLEDDNLVNRPGPRIVEGLKIIASLIHKQYMVSLQLDILQERYFLCEEMT